MLKFSVKAKHIVSFLGLVLVLCFFSQKIFAQIEAETVIEDSDNCGKHTAAYDDLFNFANNQTETAVVIIIARLGDGETLAKYNQQRLAVAKESLMIPNKYPAEKIITAQGGKLSGKGRIEFYINGRLLTIFKVGRKKNMKGRCAE